MSLRQSSFTAHPRATVRPRPRGRPTTRLTTMFAAGRALAVLGQTLASRTSRSRTSCRRRSSPFPPASFGVPQGEPGDHPENGGPGHVDHERPVRESRPSRPEMLRSTRKRRTAPTPPSSTTPPQTSTVIAEPEPAGRRGGDLHRRIPGQNTDHGVHRRQDVLPASSIFTISTCIVENVVNPPHTPVPSSGLR